MEKVRLVHRKHSQDAYLTLTEVATILRVSEKSIRRYLGQGLFPGSKKIVGKWLIPASAVDDLLGKTVAS